MTFPGLSSKLIVLHYLGMYYQTPPHTSFQKLCVTNTIQKRRANLSKMYKKANLAKLKSEKTSVEVTMVAVSELLDTRRNIYITNIAKLSFETRYLTEDKETIVVHVANLMAGMEMGSVTRARYAQVLELARMGQLSFQDG